LLAFTLALLMSACASGGQPAGSGGADATGGATGGKASTGGAGGSGGAPASGGTTQNGGSAGITGGSRGYALPPPRQCDNQFWVSGCTKGKADTACGGVCQAANACEDISQKTGAHVGFLCPRFALGAAEMRQAAIDDFGALPPFAYGIVGHDADTGGLDGDLHTACCQCYQLVFDLPEAEAQVNGNGPSAITVPPPLIVQTFNTAAGGGMNFDIFMGAGGFGAFNACDPTFTSMKSPSGLYLYSAFPAEGEPGSGGVNAATQVAGCKNDRNLVTADTLSSATCVANVAQACSRFASSTLSASAVESSIASCKASNDPASYYHINWKIYARRIECPVHLTEVTGCKLGPQGLPTADPKVATAADAAKDSTFKPNRSTTTMQDCCKPTCAWQDQVVAQNPGLKVLGQYNSFYTCDQTGAPVTE